MNILFIADPNSIHDEKWITYFTNSQGFKTYIIARKPHFVEYSNRDLNSLPIIKSISDFSFFWIFRTIRSARIIKKTILSYDIDVINIQYAEPSALWCLLRWYFKKPMVITTLGTDVLKTIPEVFAKKNFINKLVGPAYQYVFSKADWVTGTSQRQLDSITEFSGRKDKMTVVRTGVDLERLKTDTRSFFPLKDDKPFILFPRYIKPIYNHEFCLRAIDWLPIKLKKKYRMVFVGKDCGDIDYQNSLMETMSKMTDVDFSFIGKQKQEAVFELYKKSALVVMTPVSDGSPVSAMEVLLCGVKIILGPLDYDQDIYSENVVRLSSWDPTELSETITTLLDENTEHDPLSPEVSKMMDMKYNMEIVGKIYKELAEKN
ncbi:glycosyltransferase family 4 protein [Marivirga harenae]|uniref:glycosyltransferase family 4 protein n=1 Tax=Marivirga harenae TaxID=2010992 RepID=UPI0026DEB0A1|nr:glycosyltransferase family 4 protein [Marivirga harenae]WKV13428.1 glycosyltransferase family 4 protein [Marivirga harenae]